MRQEMFLKKDVNVLVSEPRTSILGTQELFIEAGSTINLTCVIQTGGQPMASSHIYWNYNGKVRGEKLSISIAPLFPRFGNGRKEKPQDTRQPRCKMGKSVLGERKS